MKIKPVILCGGEGTRLWKKSRNRLPKQFIDFGGWTLIEKTLQRVKSSFFDYPLISTNSKYLNQVEYFLKKCKFKKYEIILEPAKKNTAPAVLSASLVRSIPKKQPILFLPSDHLLEKDKIFNIILNRYKDYLSNNNIFLFGIKPKHVSNEFGYLKTKKINGKLAKIVKFIEKPSVKKAKIIIKKKALWNSGMFLARKDSIINNFKKYHNETFKNCSKSYLKSKRSKKICLLNKKYFLLSKSNSFDYAILEKSSDIYCIALNIPWSDLGSWKEILKVYKINKSKYFKKSNVFTRPWGKYINLFQGTNFLIKELTINSKSSISLQKHNYRSEHWTITQGKPKITINNKKYLAKKEASFFIPVKTIHRIENLYQKPVKIMEAQIGSILKETDIIRYEDIYGRIN